VKNITQAGKYLFRYRAAIAAVFFVMLAFVAKPVSSIIAHVSVVAGIGIRLWAAGYIGPEARKREFHAEHRIINGPYRILRHPLYVGNFFLVLGFVVLYSPSQWLGLFYVLLCVVMYSLIAISENEYLKEKPEMNTRYRFSNLKGEASTLIVVGVVYAVWILLFVRG